MSNKNLTYLYSNNSRKAHEQLLAALGTENNPTQWLVFMQAVTELLPEVLSSGRPTKEAIKNSVIGQLGFESWQQMIEAPVKNYGLGWNFSGWKAWRRAWNVVQQHDWLLNTDMTSSEINALSIEVRKNDLSFPQSKEELRILKNERKAAQELARAESIQALKDALKIAENEKLDVLEVLKKAGFTIESMNQQLKEAQKKINEQSEFIGELKSKLNRPLTRFQRLKKLLGFTIT